MNGSVMATDSAKATASIAMARKKVKMTSNMVMDGRCWGWMDRVSQECNSFSRMSR